MVHEPERAIEPLEGAIAELREATEERGAGIAPGAFVSRRVLDTVVPVEAENAIIGHLAMAVPGAVKVEPSLIANESWGAEP